MLTASDAAEGDLFGHSVSVSGNAVLVGAPGDYSGSNGAGSAYVFRRDDEISSGTVGGDVVDRRVGWDRRETRQSRQFWAVEDIRTLESVKKRVARRVA